MNILKELNIASNLSSLNLIQRFVEEVCDEFNINKVLGVGLTIPPSYLNNFFEKKLNTLQLLNGTENFFGNNLFSASISDHYLIDLRIKK